MNTANLFTLVVPGQPCVSTFEQIGDNLVYDLANPVAVPSIGFALNTPLPEGFAASLYYSLPPFNDLQFLGAIANSRPSDIFHTGFGLKPDIAEYPLIKLVIRGEILDEKLKILVESTGNNSIQKEYVKKVAFNLYNYMSSFDTPQVDNHLVIPKNFLDKWLTKFEEKFKIDPFYILKTQIN